MADMLKTGQFYSHRSRSPVLVVTVLLLTWLLLFLSLSRGEESVKKITPPENDFAPPLGIYRYRVSWAGIPAASASVTFSREDGYYRVVADARAIGLIDKIYRLRYRGEGAIDPEDLTPIRTVLSSQEGRRRKKNVIKYQDDGRVEMIETRSEGRGEPRINKEERQFERLVFDPFSAFFLARRVAWHQGKSQEFEVFTGSDRYLIELNAVGKRQLEIAGERREAWVIIPTIENLTDPKKNNKVGAVTIYLSADERKDLLKIVSKVYIGKVKLCLESFRPEG